MAVDTVRVINQGRINAPPTYPPRRGVIHDARFDARTGFDDVIHDARVNSRTESNDVIHDARVDVRTGSDDAIYGDRVEPGAAAISAISPVKYRYRFANE